MTQDNIKVFGETPRGVCSVKDLTDDLHNLLHSLGSGATEEMHEKGYERSSEILGTLQDSPQQAAVTMLHLVRRFVRVATLFEELTGKGVNFNPLQELLKKVYEARALADKQNKVAAIEAPKSTEGTDEDDFLN